MKQNAKFDNLLKNDFNISSTYKTISLRLQLSEYKKQLQDQALIRLKQCISDIDFVSIKSKFKTDSTKKSYTLETCYFTIYFEFEEIVKNILSTKSYMNVSINNYKIKYNYLDFINLSYSKFIDDLIHLDLFEFCFLKSQFDRYKVLQYSFI